MGAVRMAGFRRSGVADPRKRILVGPLSVDPSKPIDPFWISVKL